ncbi:MAG: hypothetical protein QGD89_09025 [Actinomycetota bacterium]|nr:hypothetical protein [Actinomycetota bacterium]
MAQFMILYKGDATDVSEMTSKQVADVMAEWGRMDGESRRRPRR